MEAHFKAGLKDLINGLKLRVIGYKTRMESTHFLPNILKVSLSALNEEPRNYANLACA